MFGGKGETKLFNYLKHLKKLGYLKVLHYQAIKQLFRFAFIFKKKFHSITFFDGVIRWNWYCNYDIITK